ncbi:MAG: hypothetical protein WC526_00700 [Patescibacteria group bacterium]
MQPARARLIIVRQHVADITSALGERVNDTLVLLVPAQPIQAQRDHSLELALVEQYGQSPELRAVDLPFDCAVSENPRPFRLVRGMLLNDGAVFAEAHLSEVSDPEAIDPGVLAPSLELILDGVLLIINVGSTSSCVE